MAVKDIDKGWKGIKKELKKLSKAPRVEVGVRGKSALESKKGRDGKRDINVTVVDVATIHEYGSKSRGIPERSFIRSTTDENRVKYKNLIKELGNKVIDPRSGMTAEKALAIVGETVTADIKEKIRKGIPPKLKRATITAKGSSTPLIDTGQLIGAIGYKVIKE